MCPGAPFYFFNDKPLLGHFEFLVMRVHGVRIATGFNH